MAGAGGSTAWGRHHCGVGGQSFAEPGDACDGTERPLVPRSRCLPRLPPSVGRQGRGRKSSQGRLSRPGVPTTPGGCLSKRERWDRPPVPLGFPIVITKLCTLDHISCMNKYL